MAKVHLTIFGPDHEHECPGDEVANLRGEGLLLEDAPEPSAKTPPAAPKAAASKDGS